MTVCVKIYFSFIKSKDNFYFFIKKARVLSLNQSHQYYIPLAVNLLVFQWECLKAYSMQSLIYFLVLYSMKTLQSSSYHIQLGPIFYALSATLYGGDYIASPIKWYSNLHTHILFIRCNTCCYIICQDVHTITLSYKIVHYLECWVYFFHIW